MDIRPPEQPGPAARPAPVERWAADEAVTRLYAAHYRSLVRLAAMLLGDREAAEDVVQDSFVAMHRGWRRLEDPDKGLAYLRQAVVNRSRSSLRRRAVARRHAPAPMPDAESAEGAAMTALEGQLVMAAVRHLPPRQREALVLRYYLDLSEAETARVMGCSRGAVKSHTSRAAAAVRAAMTSQEGRRP